MNGLERTPTAEAHFQSMRADYDAAHAQNNRFMRQRNRGRVGDDSFDFNIKNQRDYFAIVGMARGFERNEPLLRQAIRRLKSNVRVDGMIFDPKTGDSDVDKHLEDRWGAWSTNSDLCDFRRRFTFNELSNLALGRTTIDGDCFGVGRSNGSLQAMESHRCRESTRGKKNRGVCGVRLYKSGEPFEYGFTREDSDPFAMTRVKDLEKITARNKKDHLQVWHRYRAQSFSQSRGVSSIAPAIHQIGMRDDLDFAKLVEAKIVSCITFMEKWAATPDGAMAYQESNQSDEVLGSFSGKKELPGTMPIRPGMHLKSKGPGHSWDAFSPNTPNDGYFQFGHLLMTYMAVNLDLPLIILLLDASTANFSQFRHVLEQARGSFHQLRTEHANQWSSPTARWKIRNWIDQGDPVLLKFLREEQAKNPRLPLAESALFRHGWNQPGYEYIEPVKDATRWILERANGQITDREFFAQRGKDWKEHWSQVVNERKHIITLGLEAAAELEAEYPNLTINRSVDLRQLIPLPVAEGVRVNVVDNLNEPDQPPAIEQQGTQP